MSFIYLASPYSHPDPEVRQHRFMAACEWAGRLMKEGHTVFSPIAHSHAIEQTFDAIEPGPFWMKQDIPILRHADKVVVLKLEGWDRSKGIAQEIELATCAMIPVEYLDPYEP